MGDKIFKVVSALIGLAVIIWIVSNVTSSRHAVNEQERERLETKIQIEQGISEIVARHNAVTDWKKSLEEEGYPYYTIQIEEALTRNDSRSILFFASVEDVVRQDGKYFVHFQKWEWPIGLEPWFDPISLGIEIRFVLECNPEQIKKIMDQPTNWFEKYAVVAKISHVRRPGFQIEALPIDSEEAELFVSSCDIFIASGDCLDLLFIAYRELWKLYE